MEVDLLKYPARVNFTHTVRDLNGLDRNIDAIRVRGRVMRADDDQWFLYEDGIRTRVDLNETLSQVKSGDYVIVNGDYLVEENPLLVAKKVQLCSRSINVVRSDRDTRDFCGLELLADNKKRENIFIRAKAIKTIRSFLDSRGYVEVETPNLRYFPSSSSTQMRTQSKINGHEYFLRGSPEKHIQRLALSIPKFYEIGKCFRDDKCDDTHSPEFTMLEFYSTFADYKDMMGLSEELIETVALETQGTTVLHFRGHEIDVKRPWKRISVRDASKQEYGLDPIEVSTSELKRILGIREDLSKEALITRFIESKLEGIFIQPTFLTNYPTGVGSPDKTNEFDRKTMERSEGFLAGGLELVNIGTSNNDPLFLRDHYVKNIERRYGADKVAEYLDEDFLFEMGCGVPPLAGSGMGIDRLVMVLTGERNINRVMCYPFRK